MRKDYIRLIKDLKALLSAHRKGGVDNVEIVILLDRIVKDYEKIIK